MPNKTEIDQVIERWTNEQEVLLRAGEMEAQELRTAMAVLKAFAREIKMALAGQLILSSYQQTALAEICSLVATPAYRIGNGEMPNIDMTKLSDDLIDHLQRFDKIDWNDLYDKLHRSGANF